MPSSATYMSAYSARRYLERKIWAVEMLGGKCGCGSIVDLRFEYIDRARREFSITRRLNSAALAALEPEIRKCRLVCRECRRSGVPHGGGRTGRRNCPCEPCRERKRAYMHEYHKVNRLVASLNLKG